MSAALRVVSVGYEGRSIEDLVSVLRDAGVRRLIDVREFAFSRRVEYRKRALEQALSDAGIHYEHVKEAGNPFRREKADLRACLRAYRGYLKRNPEVLESVVRSMDDVPAAFLCYERQHDHCHRSVLLKALVDQGHSLELVAVE